MTARIYLPSRNVMQYPFSVAGWLLGLLWR
jgi:hypothetical protein